MNPLFLLFSLAGCGDKSSCNAVFDLVFPDGTQAAMDACEKIDATGSFEFDPDDPAEFRSVNITLWATEDGSSDCWFQLDLSGVCGAGRYLIGEGSQVAWATHDCSGISDAHEASYVAVDGALELTLLSAGEELGPPSEDTITAFLAGEVSVTATDGTLLSGTFDLVQAFSWTDTEDKLCSDTVPTDTTGDTGSAATGRLSVSPTALHFDTTTTGTVGVESILLANLGAGDLFIESIESDNSVWSWRGNSLPRVINPGQSSTVYVDFLPVEAVAYTGSLSISSDDPLSPTVVVDLTGSGG
jgi:hypothetical protein